MPLDRARAEEQPGADLRIRTPVTGEPGYLRLLRGELTGRLGRARAVAADVAVITRGQFR